MEREQIVEELNSLIKEGKEKVLSTKWYPQGVVAAQNRVNLDVFAGWHTKALSFLKLSLSETNDFVTNFSKLNNNYYSHACSCIKILESVLDYTNKGFLSDSKKTSLDVDAELNRIFSRFHKIARQLRSRYANRTTIDITDEYDVQDRSMRC